MNLFTSIKISKWHISIFVYAVVLMNEEITLFKEMDLAEGISGVVITDWGAEIFWKPVRPPSCEILSNETTVYFNHIHLAGQYL